MNITPPSTPAPKPATPPPAPPSTGPKLSLFTLDEDETRLFQPTDEDAEKRLKEQQPRLLLLRQEFEKLALERADLLERGLDTSAVTAQLRDAWHDGLFRSWHLGSWADLFPLLNGMNKAGLFVTHQNIFVLGGRFGSLARSLSKLIPPPDYLMDALEKHHVFPEAAGLLDEFQADPTPEKEEALVACCTGSPKLFAPALMGGYCNAVKLREMVSIPLPKLRASVENRLFNLPVSTMVFEPTPANPAFGWEQLWKFAWYFQQLPDITKDKFKPFHFTIRPIP